MSQQPALVTEEGNNQEFMAELCYMKTISQKSGGGGVKMENNIQWWRDYKQIYTKYSYEEAVRDMKTLHRHIFFKPVILFKEIYPKKEIQEISKISGQAHINDTGTAGELSYACGPLFK